jgi:hypothetical protein
MPRFFHLKSGERLIQNGNRLSGGRSPSSGTMAAFSDIGVIFL